MQSPIGLIGLGLLGSALAERFLAAGYDVLGFDIDESRRVELHTMGGTAATSAREVFTQARTVTLSLPTSDIVEKLLFNVANCVNGVTVIDTTTGDPEQMIEIGARIQAQGGRYIDATIAGSSVQVRAGEVIVMMGGDAETVHACEQYVRCFASRWFHVGTCGAAAKMKLVVNLVLGLQRAVLAEGLNFARKYGIEPDNALEILKASPAYCKVMDTKGSKMIHGDFSVQARLSQHLKDVRLIRSAGAKCSAALPLTTVHNALLVALEQAGHGSLDNSAIVKAFDGSLPRQHVE